MLDRRAFTHMDSHCSQPNVEYFIEFFPRYHSLCMLQSQANIADGVMALFPRLCTPLGARKGTAQPLALSLSPSLILPNLKLRLYDRVPRQHNCDGELIYENPSRR